MTLETFGLSRRKYIQLREGLGAWALNRNWSSLGLIAVIVTLAIIFSLLNPNFIAKRTSATSHVKQLF